MRELAIKLTNFMYTFWGSIKILSFIYYVKVEFIKVLKSQVVDKRPINSPIPGRCY